MIIVSVGCDIFAFSVLTLLFGQQEEHLASKNFKTPWDGS